VKVSLRTDPILSTVVRYEPTYQRTDLQLTTYKLTQTDELTYVQTDCKRTTEITHVLTYKPLLHEQVLYK